jgi:hypothetical protein
MTDPRVFMRTLAIDKKECGREENDIGALFYSVRSNPRSEELNSG